MHQESTYKEENRENIFSDNDKEEFTGLEHLEIICAKMIMKCVDIVYKVKVENTSEEYIKKEYFVRPRCN